MGNEEDLYSNSKSEEMNFSNESLSVEMNADIGED